MGLFSYKFWLLLIFIQKTWNDKTNPSSLQKKKKKNKSPVCRNMSKNERLKANNGTCFTDRAQTCPL